MWLHEICFVYVIPLPSCSCTLARSTMVLSRLQGGVFFACLLYVVVALCLHVVGAGLDHRNTTVDGATVAGRGQAGILGRDDDSPPVCVIAVAVVAFEFADDVFSGAYTCASWVVWVVLPQLALGAMIRRCGESRP